MDNETGYGVVVNGGSAVFDGNTIEGFKTCVVVNYGAPEFKLNSVLRAAQCGLLVTKGIGAGAHDRDYCSQERPLCPPSGVEWVWG